MPGFNEPEYLLGIETSMVQRMDRPKSLGFNEPEYLLGIETGGISRDNVLMFCFNEPEYLLGIETTKLFAGFAPSLSVSMSQNTF